MRHCFEQPDLPPRAFRKALGKNRPATLEGGGKGGDAPSSPDPWIVAGAQIAQNNATAEFSKALNLNNYTNPFGSQQSKIVGTDPSTGAPIYNTTISASPELQQALGGLLAQTGNAYGVQQSAMGGLSGLGGSYAGLNGNLQGIQNEYQAMQQGIYKLGAGLDPEAAKQAQQNGQDAAYRSSMGYLTPQFQQAQTSLDSQLANQGLTPGSQAWDNAQGNLSRNQTFQQQPALNNAELTGSQIGTQNLQNQIARINAGASLYGLGGSNLAQAAGLSGMQSANLGALGGLYGQQVGLSQIPYQNLSTIASLIPGNTGTAQSATSPANIAQAFQNQYQGQLNAYNAQTASANSTMGGLFGLGSSALLAGAMFMSDRRLKTDIVPIGRLDDGMTFYRFRYRWNKPGIEHYGVMADEVKRVRPDAVMRHPSGYDMIDYAKIGAAHHAG